MMHVKALVVALMAALVFAGVQTLRLANERTAHAVTKNLHADERTGLERATRAAVEAARLEEQRRSAVLQGVIDETEQKLAQARADADAAGHAGERLRKRITELAAGSCRGATGNTDAAGAGQTAHTASDLLADVQRRLDEATDGIARFADQAHAAGKACERGWGALTPPALGR
jgi:hypothetical protein